MSENKTYLWEADHIQLLRNQLLTGYKAVKSGTEVSFIKLTEKEMKEIEEEITHLSNHLNNPK